MEIARRWILTLCLALTGMLGYADERRLEVLELQHRPAKEILPMIAPLADPGVGLTGSGMRIILKAEPAAAAELKQMIQIFDVPQRNLVLSVSLQSEDEDVGGDGATSVTVTLGGRSVLDPRRRKADGEIRVVASGEGLSESRDTIETVRVTEGSTAHVRIGETRVLRRDRRSSLGLRPVVRIGAGGGPDGGDSGSVTEVLTWWGRDYARPILLRNTGLELAMTPTLLSDARVRIEIYRTAANEETGDRLAVPTTRAQTVVTGKLGEWLTIATLSRDTLSRSGQGDLDNAATVKESRLLRIRADLAN